MIPHRYEDRYEARASTCLTAAACTDRSELGATGGGYRMSNRTVSLGHAGWLALNTSLAGWADAGDDADL